MVYTIELFAGNVYASNANLRSDGIPLRFLVNIPQFNYARINFDKVVLDTTEGEVVVGVREVQKAYNKYQRNK